MANWNGLVASLTQTRIIGTSFVTVNTEMPNKFFKHGQFAIRATEGVSGTLFVNVIGAVGGATFVIAGRSNITAVGSFPMPQFLYGQSGTPTGIGYPRPIGVNFTGTGTTWGVGITASVFFAGDY